MEIKLKPGDALIVVDVQKDFLPGGSLAVAEGDKVVPALNRYIAAFEKARLPIFATRCWHPENHCSFKPQGGPWPPHCVAGSEGARFAPNLRLPEEAKIVSKATASDKDAYSGFEGTELDRWLKDGNVKRIFVGGLATDYCVLNTVKDALTLGYETLLLSDGIRAVNVHQGDGKRAEEEMTSLGAKPIDFSDLAA
jgi:nicotinamidase/pyrazinamidase